MAVSGDLFNAADCFGVLRVATNRNVELQNARTIRLHWVHLSCYIFLFSKCKNNRLRATLDFCEQKEFSMKCASLIDSVYLRSDCENNPPCRLFWIRISPLWADRPKSFSALVEFIIWKFNFQSRLLTRPWPVRGAPWYIKIGSLKENFWFPLFLALPDWILASFAAEVPAGSSPNGDLEMLNSLSLSELLV